MASALTVVLIKNSQWQQLQSYCVCESVCETPSQPCCMGHHRLQSDLPSPSSPTGMGIPFLPGHPREVTGNPAAATGEGFWGSHVSANTYLKNCSYGSVLLLSLFPEVLTEHLSQGLTGCPARFTELQSHSSACSPFPAVHPL